METYWATRRQLLDEPVDANKHWWQDARTACGDPRADRIGAFRRHTRVRPRGGNICPACLIVWEAGDLIEEAFDSYVVPGTLQVYHPDPACFSIRKGTKPVPGPSSYFAKLGYRPCKRCPKETSNHEPETTAA